MGVALDLDDSRRARGRHDRIDLLTLRPDNDVPHHNGIGPSRLQIALQPANARVFSAIADGTTTKAPDRRALRNHDAMVDTGAHRSRTGS